MPVFYLGYVNDFLSWRAFAPLSKISFIMYLIHIDLETYMFGLQTTSMALTVTVAVSAHRLIIMTKND